MSKSLAELRASSRTSLPERAYSLCLAQSLVAELQALEEEALGELRATGARPRRRPRLRRSR